MATIKQIKSQIETSEKRILDYKKKIDMYNQRLNKVIESVNKSGFSISINDIETKEIKYGNAIRYSYKLSDVVRSSVDFEISHKIENNFDYIKENEKKLNSEIKYKKSLENELESLIEKRDKESIEYNKSLESLLQTTLGEFKKVWFERMMNWFDSHYDYINSISDETRKTKKRVDVMRSHFDIKRKYHYRIINLLENHLKKCSYILSDVVNVYKDKSEYLDFCKRELEYKWSVGIVTLVNKCKSFNIDESLLKIQEPNMTEKGFEVYITDGKPRIIYARLIWAAENSFLVEPHTRYIITEKKINDI